MYKNSALSSVITLRSPITLEIHPRIIFSKSNDISSSFIKPNLILVIFKPVFQVNPGAEHLQWMFAQSSQRHQLVVEHPFANRT